MNKNKRKQFRWIALLVLGLPIVIVLFYWLTKLLTGVTPDDIFLFAGGNVVIEVLLVLGIYAVKAVLFFIPVAFLYILTGNLFPPVYSILINIIGLSVTMSLTFWLGKKLGRNLVKKIIRKSPKVERFMDDSDKSRVTLFALRASNVFPVELISLVCGSTGYRFWSFLGLSLLAMVPTLIPFTLMGDSLKDPLSPGFLIPFGIVLAMMAGSLIVYKIKHKEE